MQATTTKSATANFFMNDARKDCISPAFSSIRLRQIVSRCQEGNTGSRAKHPNRESLRLY
jgi:hypothetical protein